MYYPVIIYQTSLLYHLFDINNVLYSGVLFMEKYIAFDVETPNARNSRMSAIGIAVIENKKITNKFFSLINPETYFSSFNIELTGITPQSVKTAPTFPELWKKIEPLMTGGILIAHNAAFDMKVLGTCLNDYGITTDRYKKYACTVQLGRKCFPELPNHKLNTMCDHLNINLDHHKADSDSIACAKLLIEYMKSDIDINKFIRTYDFEELKTVKP